MRTRSKGAWTFAVAFVMLAAGCGGDNPMTNPSPPAGGGGGGGTTSTTITITTSGVTPKTLTVTAGTQVTFTNNDTRNHDMESDPHPEHTDCPAIGQAGFITPGQSRQTGNLNVVRTCGYHDHNDDQNPAWKGSIVIQ